MSPETALMFTAEAAAGSAVRAVCDNDPVVVGTAAGFLAGVTMFVLPPEAATAVLSLVVPFAASQLTHMMVVDELKERLK